MSVAQWALVFLVALDSIHIPADPGFYYVTPRGMERVEGHAVTVERSAGKLPPLPLMKGAMPLGGGKVKAEILGEHAEEEVTSAPVFYYRVARDAEGTGAADLVLVKLKAKRGRRGFELSDKADWNAGSGISLNSQVRITRKEIESGAYKLVPTEDLDPGEYGFYQHRGHDMPGLLYDFSVE